MTHASDARFWDRISRKYAKSAIADQEGYERSLDRTRALLRSEDRVLELGCGTGTTALRLAPHVQSYLATDFSPQMIAIADDKRRAHGQIPALVFRTATAENLAGKPEQFDAVLGFNYLHLVRDVPATLRCIHKMLAPEGLFISKTPCLSEMNPLIRLAMLPAMRAVGKAPFVTAFTAEDLHQLLTAAGFEVIATERHATKGKDARPYIVARKGALVSS